MTSLPSNFSLYLHFPFCLSKCRYCDFNSYAGLNDLIPRYIEALVKEMGLWVDSPASVNTIYFGGGTPSLLSAEQVDYIIRESRQSFALVPTAEITLEANPGTVDKKRLGGWRAAGVNRLSLGVQSFDDEELKLLGRIHTVKEAIEAFRLAREVGFDNVNLDLIYALPRQSLAGWQSTLEKALGLEPEHLSLYSLTLEEDTPLSEDLKKGVLSSPDPDLAAEMYLLAEEVLGKAGYEHYEISNWAEPGKRCRHNLTYWYNLPYLGLGAGAHSCLGGYRFHKVLSPQDYVMRLEGCESPSPLPGLLPRGGAIEAVEEIPPSLEMAETMILGLRLGEGVDKGDFARRFGVELSEEYRGTIEELLGLDLLREKDSALQLTSRGRLLGNEVFWRFLPGAKQGATAKRA